MVVGNRRLTIQYAILEKTGCRKSQFRRKHIRSAPANSSPLQTLRTDSDPSRSTQVVLDEVGVAGGADDISRTESIALSRAM